MGDMSPPALATKGNAMRIIESACTATNEGALKSRKTLAAVLALLLCLPGLAAADRGQKCNENILKGRYVFTASGFTRPPASGPGTPWVPKAIVEVRSEEHTSE